MKVRSRRRRGGLFVLIGILTILGVTFVAGVYTGRISLARSLVTAARLTEPDPERRAGGRGARPDTATPRLTFYQELTAPLTAPPPPPKPAKTSPPPLVSAPAPAVALPPQHPGEQADALSAATEARAAGAATRFTVQIAAYRARPPAEALRTTLAAAGHDARVVESDGGNSVMYRVQVGEFATRDAARAAATRLAAERSLVPFVTPR
jgi:cell division protein FtsN